MDYNSTLILNELPTYTNELGASTILNQAVLVGHSLQYVSIIENCKNAQAIPYLTSNMVVTPENCGLFSATGSVTLAENVIQVAKLQVQEQICLPDLENYWTAMTMPGGSYYDGDGLTPKIFAEAFTVDKIQNLGYQIEQLLWVGSSGTTYVSGQPNLAQANGWLYFLEQTPASLSVNTATASLSQMQNIPYQGSTQSGPYEIFQNGYTNWLNLVNNITSRKDLCAFTSFTNFRNLIQACINKNIYNMNWQTTIAKQGDGGNDIYNILLIGTNMNVVGAEGLTGCNNKILFAPSKLLFAGYDAVNDATSFKIWYETLLNAVLFRSIFKLGTAAVFPNYMYLVTLE